VFGEAAEDEPADVGQSGTGGQYFGKFDGELPRIGLTVRGVVVGGQKICQARTKSVGDEGEYRAHSGRSRVITARADPDDARHGIQEFDKTRIHIPVVQAAPQWISVQQEFRRTCAVIRVPKLKIEIGPERWTWKIGIQNNSQRIVDVATNASGRNSTSPKVTGWVRNLRRMYRDCKVPQIGHDKSRAIVFNQRRAEYNLRSFPETISAKG
jgi:hypothetical protein